MEVKYENVIWRTDKNKYSGIFKVGGVRYSAGYSHNPKELYERVVKLKEEKQKEFQEYLRNICEEGETWIDIEDFNGVFQISDFGRIKSFSSQKPGIVNYKNGKVSLIKGKGVVCKFYVKDLVAQYFLNTSLSENKVFNIDEGISNNSISNLKVVSKEALLQERIDKGVKEASTVIGVYYDKRKLVFMADVDFLGRSYKVRGNSVEEALLKKEALKKKLYQNHPQKWNGELLENEVFKVVPHSDNLSKISNHGRFLKTVEGVELLIEGFLNTAGYRRYSLLRRGKSTVITAHQLVAESFLGHIIDGHSVVVDHINHNTLDNRVENLQLLTNRENSSKKKKEGKGLPTGVSLTKSGNYKASAELNGKMSHLGLFITPEEASNAYKTFVENLN